MTAPGIRSADIDRDEAAALAPARWSLADSALADDLGFLFAKASALLTRHTAGILHEHGLRVRTYSALALAAAAVPPTQREIAEGLSLDPSQVVPIVDELEQRGLVERGPDPRDRRSKLVRATDAGRALGDRLAALLAADDRLGLAALHPTERDALVGLLRRLALGEG